MYTFDKPIPMGKQLEEDLVYQLVEAIPCMESCLGSEKDNYEGTDCVIYGLRYDITLNFDEKDNMIVLPEVYWLKHYGDKVRFGVRTGNSHGSFRHPVIVIGVDTFGPEFFRSWKNNIIAEIKDNIEEILELAEDQFWNWADATGVLV